MSQAYFFNMTAHQIALNVAAGDQVTIDGLSGEPYTPNYQTYKRTDLEDPPANEFGAENPVAYHISGSDIQNNFHVSVTTDQYSSDDTDILIYLFMRSMVGMAAEDSKPYLSQNGVLKIPAAAEL
ncbi:MAG: hypothetical protein ACRDPC_01315 [Solirubrobacteraceae bacterium]